MGRPPAVALGMLERNLGCIAGTFCAASVSNFSALECGSDCQAGYRTFEKFQPLLNVPLRCIILRMISQLFYSLSSQVLPRLPLDRSLAASL